MGNKTRKTSNLVSDNNIFVDISNDRVGIGSTQPTAKLDVDGRLNVSGVSTFVDQVNISPSSGNGKIKYTGSNVFIIEGGTASSNDIRIDAHQLATNIYCNAQNSTELHFAYPDSTGGKKLETTGYGVSVYGDARISGILTVGAGTSTIGVESPTFTISNNNSTIAGTAGTIGEIKQIGGAPFYYDGTAWREFALLEGTPVTTPGDTDWDNVMFRMDFEESGISSVTNLKNERSPHSTGFSNIDLVSSPGMTNFGKSLRFSANHNTLSWKQDPINSGTQIPLYDFEGAWTIELWIHPTSLPTNGANVAEQDSMLFVGQLDPSGTRDWGFGLMYDNGTSGTASNNNYSFYWYNNDFSGTTSGTPGSAGSPFVLHTVVGNTLLNTWNHVALVRRQSNSEIELYLNGSAVGNSVIDTYIQNGSTNYVDSYITFGGYPDLTDAYRRRFYGNIDDVRITTDERYTGNSFTVPTSPHPTTGTTSTVYTPPNSKQGEIALGASPTWTGTTGVGVTQVASGHYRLTFSSAYSSTTAYTVNANMMDDVAAATSIVGVGVSRVSSSTCDFYVKRLLNGVGNTVDTGSLAVSVYKK